MPIDNDGTLQDMVHALQGHFHYALESFKQEVLNLDTLGHMIHEIECQGGDISQFSGDETTVARLVFSLHRDWNSLSDADWQADNDKVLEATLCWCDVVSKNPKKRQRSQIRLEALEKWIVALGFIRLKHLREITAEAQRKNPPKPQASLSSEPSISENDRVYTMTIVLQMRHDVCPDDLEGALIHCLDVLDCDGFDGVPILNLSIVNERTGQTFVAEEDSESLEMICFHANYSERGNTPRFPSTVPPEKGEAI